MDLYAYVGYVGVESGFDDIIHGKRVHQGICRLSVNDVQGISTGRFVHRSTSQWSLYSLTLHSSYTLIEQVRQI